MAVHSLENGTGGTPWKNSRRRLSLVEQLRGCQDAWCPAAPWDRERAHAAIRGAPIGSFLAVRDPETSQPCLLCVSGGGDDAAVLDYNITYTGKVFQLSGSRLSFSDLAQLVLFYSLTRDVLAVCLSIPRWIYSVTENTKHRLTTLEPETWLCTPSDLQTDEVTRLEPSSVMCSIQLTSANGALCIINPLYLHEHGDDWLQGTAKQATHFRSQRRLSTTRTWAGAGVKNKRTVSLDQASTAPAGAGAAAAAASPGVIRAKSADSSPTSAIPPGVVLRRPSRDAAVPTPSRASTGSLNPTTPTHALDPQRHSSPVPQSPHRVSWIEDGVWLPPPRSSSALHPPSLELDSLSISSIEEELESPSSPSHHPLSAHRLADKVMYRLSAVGQALGGLVSSKKRLINRVQELSERRGGAFAEAVRGFIDTTLKRTADPGKVTGSEFLQEVRSSLTSLRETLLDYPDIQALLDSITDLNDQEIDTLLESSVHKVALKPISEQIYSCIRSCRSSDGSLQQLENNLHVLEQQDIVGLGGSAGVGIPDAVSMERIQQRWISMHEAYSPNKKVQILLKVCKSIYDSMSANSSSGAVFGADDFLPCLTWVLLRSQVVTLQLDTDYMMELLDPTQLQGEGGYYLTTLYASLFYISSFRPRLAARQLSVEAQHSINQWHRRRTLHCNQSRRSKHRRTFRRQACRDRGLQGSEEEECKEKNEEEQHTDAGEAEVESEEGDDGARTADQQETIEE